MVISRSFFKRFALFLCIAGLPLAGLVYFKITHEHRDYKIIFDDMPSLEVGDVILRMGQGIDSYIIVKTTDSVFSHVAMIASVNPAIIIHATTADDGAIKDMVIEQSMDTFLKNARSVAVVRHNLNAIHKAKIAKYLRSQLGRDFILEGGRQDFYCSTLVSNALSVYKDMTYLKSTFIDTLMVQGSFVLPDEFYKDKSATVIYIK